jgi:hypothetical protein
MDTPRTDRGARSSVEIANAAVLVVFYLLYYTEITFSLFGRFTFPDAGCFLTAIISCSINRAQISQRIVNLFAITCAVLLVDAVVVSFSDALLGKRILAALHLTFSMFSAYGAYLAASQIGRERVSSIFRVIYVVITAGAFLEIVGIMRPISDAVRVLLYGHDIYSSVGRDVVQYGGIRPSFFGREPSLVGVNAGFALSLWLLTRKSGVMRDILESAILATICTLISYYIVRSPTVVFYYVIIMFGLFLRADLFQKRRGLRLAVSGFTWSVFAVLLLPTMVAGAYLVGGNIAWRLVSDPSVFIRIVAPPIVGLNVLMHAPILGVGVGAYEALADFISPVYGAVGLAHRSTIASNPSFWISNAFWEYWDWGGLVGGLGFYFLIRKFVLALGSVETIFPFVAMSVALQSMGGIIAIRAWIFFALYVLISQGWGASAWSRK